MKKILGASAFLFFFLPSLASAAIFCPTLSQDMWYGTCDSTISDPDCSRYVTGTQVGDLQHFLRDYFNATSPRSTGYFGAKTKQIVIQFQNENDLPSTGRVGPLTRRVIADMCTTGN